MVYTVIKWSLRDIHVGYQVAHQDGHVAAVLFGSRYRPGSIEDAKRQARTLCALLNVGATVSTESKRRAGIP